MKPLFKTPISYYGGKQAMLSNILPLIPDHKVYAEPFFWGGAVFFAKAPAHIEVVNDKNNLVINFYRQLQNNFEALNHEIQLTLHSRTLQREANNIMKNPENIPDLKKAWAFWVATNMSFSNKIGGGFKYSIDQFTPAAKITCVKRQRFTRELQRRIENTEIENSDALQVIKSRDTKATFFYIDPPYIGADNGHYKGYTEQDFFNLLELLSKIKGKFLLSCYHTDTLTEFKQKNNWLQKEIIKPLMRAKNIDGRNKIEVLTANYNIFNPGSMDLFHVSK